jgi:hypothetical protein
MIFHCEHHFNVHYLCLAESFTFFDSPYAGYINFSIFDDFEMIAVKVKGMDPKYTWEIIGAYRRICWQLKD